MLEPRGPTTASICRRETAPGPFRAPELVLPAWATSRVRPDGLGRLGAARAEEAPGDAAGDTADAVKPDEADPADDRGAA